MRCCAGRTWVRDAGGGAGPALPPLGAPEPGGRTEGADGCGLGCPSDLLSTRPGTQEAVSVFSCVNNP